MPQARSETVDPKLGSGETGRVGRLGARSSLARAGPHPTDPERDSSDSSSVAAQARDGYRLGKDTSQDRLIKSPKIGQARWPGWTTAQVGRGDAKVGLDGQADRRTDNPDTNGRQDRHRPTGRTRRSPPSRHARPPGRARPCEGGRRWAPGRARTCETRALDCQRGKAGVRLVTPFRRKPAASQELALLASVLLPELAVAGSTAGSGSASKCRRPRDPR